MSTIKKVSYYLDYGASETVSSASSTTHLVNYCLVYGTSETGRMEASKV